MTPNIQHHNGRIKDDGILLECECSGFHYLEFDSWDKASGQVMISFIDRSSGLWKTLRNWWKHREMWVAEIIISEQDSEAIIKKLKTFRKGQNNVPVDSTTEAPPA